RFLVEPPAVFRACLPLRLFRRAQSLQRDAIARDEVLAQVHDAHAAATELANDLVPLAEDGTDIVSRRRRRCGSVGTGSLSTLRHEYRKSLARIAPSLRRV